jgi:hypothetical protein
MENVHAFFPAQEEFACHEYIRSIVSVLKSSPSFCIENDIHMTNTGIFVCHFAYHLF